MPSTTLEEFEDKCGEVLGDLLLRLGFRAVGAYSRPKGYAVEFARGDDRFFADYEGGVLGFDMMLRAGPDSFYRVDLLTMLWFKRVRTLVKYRDWIEGLILFAEEFEPFVDEVFPFETATIDSRYWFPVNREQRDRHVGYQRGTA